MKNRSLVLLIAAATMFGLCAAVVIGNQSFRTIEIRGSVKAFDNLNELSEDSDLVVLVKATENRENIIKGNTILESWGYTLTGVDIERVLQGDIQIRPILEVGEPYYVQGTNLIVYEDYTPMKSGSYYILFLDWHPGWNCYAVKGLAQGKHNIDGTDKDERGSPHVEKLRRQVLNHYELEITNMTKAY